MRKLSISSFEKDHDTIKCGVSVSRVDKVGVVPITTYDIRVCIPNKESMSPKAAHSIEHLGAVWFRNLYKYKDDVIYFGPMGCLTGFYLILKGNKKIEDVGKAVDDMFSFVVTSTEVPGATRRECGNYKLHSLRKAKRLANKYLIYEVLQ